MDFARSVRYLVEGGLRGEAARAPRLRSTAECGGKWPFRRCRSVPPQGGAPVWFFQSWGRRTSRPIVRPEDNCKDFQPGRLGWGKRRTWCDLNIPRSPQQRERISADGKGGSGVTLKR